MVMSWMRVASTTSTATAPSLRPFVLAPITTVVAKRVRCQLTGS